MSHCSICCDGRATFPCPYCKESACHRCVLAYFRTTKQMQCMFCHQALLYTHVSEYKEMQCLYLEMLIRYHQTEMAHQVMELHNFRDCYQRCANIQEMHMEMCEVNRTYDIDVLKEEIHRVEKTILEYRAALHETPGTVLGQYKELRMQYEAYRETVFPLEEAVESEKRHLTSVIGNRFKYGNEGDTLVDKPLFDVIRCSCRGFVDLASMDKACISCERRYCATCWSQVADEHVCSADQVLSVEAQKSQTQCPVCRLCIERSEGCDTMFCVNCQTGFTFDGKVVQGDDPVVLNPHFFETPIKRSHFTNGFSLTMDHFALKRPESHIYSVAYKGFKMRSYLLDVLQYEVLDDAVFQCHTLPGVHPIHIVLHNVYRHLHKIEMGLQNLYANIRTEPTPELMQQFLDTANNIDFVDHVCQQSSHCDSITTRSMLKSFFNKQMNRKYHEL